ncbi:hypothetical protein Avbf_08575 [Armadillidium vulgare]|nr:hypothetical protein Avbf_08575 [Armadillidium vulgare]
MNQKLFWITMTLLAAVCMSMPAPEAIADPRPNPHFLFGGIGIGIPNYWQSYPQYYGGYGNSYGYGGGYGGIWWIWI